MNVAVVAPDATVTEAGTVSDALLSATVTAAPPVAAAAEIVTVHIELPPDTTVDGAHCSCVTVGRAAVIVTEDIAVVAFNVAVTVTA